MEDRDPNSDSQIVHSLTIEPSRRPKFLYRYRVAGRGTFPFKALRYSHAWPATERDAILIGMYWDRRMIRCINLYSYSWPDAAIWKVYCWQIIELSTQ